MGAHIAFSDEESPRAALVRVTTRRLEALGDASRVTRDLFESDLVERERLLLIVGAAV